MNAINNIITKAMMLIKKYGIIVHLTIFIFVCVDFSFNIHKQNKAIINKPTTVILTTDDVDISGGVGTHIELLFVVALFVVALFVVLD
jgi:hypothetical protein